MMQEDEKEVDPSTQKVHENDFVVGADPGNTYIVTDAVPSVRKMVLIATYVRKIRVC